MSRSRFLAAALLLIPMISAAQGRPHGTAGWDVFTGAAVVRSTPNGAETYNYGWDFSVTERPYDTYPWVGGTIEGTGVYSSSSSSTSGASIVNASNVYTAMAGPVVQPRLHGVRPYAHALFGAVIVTNTGTFNGASTGSTTEDYFGQALGGGVDLSVSRHAALRAQADWLRIWNQSATDVNRVRLCGGLVFTF